jgi:hypothetical protein
MNVFDKFIMGDTSSINWCFENRHFIQRLDENGISREYIVDCLLNEEPISWEHVEREKYAAVFKAPPSKDSACSPAPIHPHSTACQSSTGRCPVPSPQATHIYSKPMWKALSTSVVPAALSTVRK